MERRLALSISGLIGALAALGGMHEPCDSDTDQVENNHGSSKIAHIACHSGIPKRGVAWAFQQRSEARVD